MNLYAIKYNYARYAFDFIPSQSPLRSPCPLQHT